jgi:predicted NAD/FAD-dependent oxidoreductase
LAGQRPALTIQAGAEWSAAHINDTAETSIAQLIDKYQLASGCSVGNILHAQAHRWLYAKVTTAAAPDAMICQYNLAIAGDWLGGARVEHAFTSGIRALQTLTKTALSNS